METKTKISELIVQIGKEAYGENFNLEEGKIKEAYKQVYQTFCNRLKGKSKKSVFLIGGVGVGKTAMMKVYQRLLKDTESRFKWVNSYELKDMSEIMTISEIKDVYGRNLNCDLYIDDIGFSIDVKRYGNTVNIISEIIMERYDLYIQSGYLTHFSSNIIPTSKIDNLPTIEKMYGVRVLDRMKEMCNLITFNGESLRK